MTDAAHPLSVSLAASLVRLVTPRILVLGAGNGRNLPPLLAAGGRVDVLDDDAARIASLAERFHAEAGLRLATGSFDDPFPFESGYDGVLSTHALLHGNRTRVRSALNNAFAAARAGARLHLVLGSCSDPRSGQGRDLGDGAFAPEDGDEAGVPHVYFTEGEVRQVLGAFTLDSLEERSAAKTAGRWAHDAASAAQMVHWFVRARR